MNEERDRYQNTEWERIRKMTSEELRQQLIDEGVDPDAEIEKLRQMGRDLRAKYAPQIAESRLRSSGAPGSDEG